MIISLLRSLLNMLGPLGYKYFVPTGLRRFPHAVLLLRNTLTKHQPGATVYSDIRKPSFLWQRLHSCVSESPNARRPLWQIAQFCARELARCSTGEIELT